MQTHKPAKEKMIRFRVGNEWGEWQSCENMKAPELMSACEIRETITQEQLDTLRKDGVL